MKRYQVVMWCADCGADDGRDFDTLTEARRELNRVLRGKMWDAACIFDCMDHRVVDTRNYFPVTQVFRAGCY